ncbi:hypothetical protein JFL43_17775 [Viridibacillus sp. YIM B01967]|uniref:Uncharacterized protein n=1 Tax=Viridibacillus soli TaxID=2798301 RepID=A0ABS1HBB1_9BACL|nr:hypothetical protein [Viridibacillus soli]MBK3496676.1 hypothetical protein [Viridibacillus soli]
MKYSKSQMQKLINENKELHQKFKELKKSMGLEKNYAMKALYHAEVTDGGPYQRAYQELDDPKY